MGLVLTRKLNEQILIGDEITITVVRLGKDAVRLAIDCPRHLPIHRSGWNGIPTRFDRFSGPMELAGAVEGGAV